MPAQKSARGFIALLSRSSCDIRRSLVAERLLCLKLRVVARVFLVREQHRFVLGIVVFHWMNEIVFRPPCFVGAMRGGVRLHTPCPSPHRCDHQVGKLRKCFIPPIHLQASFFFLAPCMGGALPGTPPAGAPRCTTLRARFPDWPMANRGISCEAALQRGAPPGDVPCSAPP